MILYFDASALVKRYVQESGSAWVVAQCTPKAQNIVLTALITKAEAAAALAAKTRMGGLAAEDHEKVEQLLFRHFAEEYVAVAIDSDLVDLAATLAKRHGLRGYDAVQLAAGVTAKQVLEAAQSSPPTFVAADERLRAAAEREGMPVEDPEKYP